MTVGIDEALQRVQNPMDAACCTAVIELLMSGEPSADQGGELLARWAERGVDGEELAAVVRLLRRRASKVLLERPSMDLCGTGGSGLTRFNVSTTAAFVLAAADIPVAKHGNRGSTRRNGSFDLLEELQIPFAELDAEAIAQLQRDTGVCFLFARSHHPAVKAVVPYRQAAGCRSVFNLAGPLANPAPIGAQVVGCNDAETGAVLADAAQRLGVPRALVAWGHPGIDELSITGPSGWLRVAPDGIHHGGFEEALHPRLDHGALPGGDAVENAPIFLRLLRGEETGPLHDMVCVNAGAAIDCWHQRDPELRGPGFQQAADLLASGQVLDCFKRHRDLARDLAGLQVHEND